MTSKYHLLINLIIKLPWLYLTVLKTNAVNFYVDKYPKVLPFCEITQSKSHRKYWQKISENNKIHLCDPHKSRCIKMIDEGHGDLQIKFELNIAGIVFYNHSKCIYVVF